MPMEYAGQVTSALINGEVTLAVEDDGITMSALFDAYHLPYAIITAIEVRDYAVHITAETGSFTITRLGNVCEMFFGEVYAAYNSKVRKALFVEGTPLLRIQGGYRYVEDEKTAQGTAVIEVYERCVLILPPDDGGRRIPLCFTSRLEKADFGLSLELDTGERYTFIRLGHDADAFGACIEKRLHSLRENAVNAAREIDGTLNAQQLSAIARIMPEGAAVPMDSLHEIAPSFVNALESRIAESRVADEYQVFKEMCDPLRICVGMKSGLAGENAENLLWLIAPGKKPNTAAVEFATSEEVAAATFLYGTFENGELFWKKLNHAMEAIDFKREVIRLKDGDLQKPAYADYAMAIKRNSALGLIRRHFTGRVIHASPERWKQELATHMA